MNKPNIIIISAVIVIFLSCTGSQKELQSENKITNSTYSPSDGFQLLEQNCFSCHSPNALEESKIAPTMAEIKKQYLLTSTNEDEFTEQIITFLENPSEVSSKMPDAIKQFGLMPKMNFPVTQMISMSKYTYRSGIEKPDWFEKYYEEERKNYSITSNELTPIEKGQQLAMQTKGVLGKNLLNAIQTKGVENALEFCSVKAIELTDSVAQSLDAKIKRVSDKNRNPENAADENELKYIFQLKELLAQNQKPKPQIIEKNNRWIAYYPILIDKMCLQCHGRKNTEILPKTLSKINELYPDDKAFGYKENELRGIWVVDMKK